MWVWEPNPLWMIYASSKLIWCPVKSEWAAMSELSSSRLSSIGFCSCRLEAYRCSLIRVNNCRDVCPMETDSQSRQLILWTQFVFFCKCRICCFVTSLEPKVLSVLKLLECRTSSKFFVILLRSQLCRIMWWWLCGLWVFFSWRFSTRCIKLIR